MEDDKIAASYDPGQRAYLITVAPAEGRDTQIKFTIEASESSPVVNPAFVIKGWGQHPPVILVDGAVPGEGDIETGSIETLNGADLVLWLRKTAVNPVKVSISTQK
jgi:hypothetical protein